VPTYRRMWQIFSGLGVVLLVVAGITFLALG
jgi:hypothetical protein